MKLRSLLRLGLLAAVCGVAAVGATSAFAGSSWSTGGRYGSISLHSKLGARISALAAKANELRGLEA